MTTPSPTPPSPQPPRATKPMPRAADPAADDARELALVQAIRSGDQNAWTELLRRYQDRLYTICYRMVHHRELAADLTQDAMVKIIQHLDTYDGRSKLSTWIIRITMNVCLSRLRAERLRRHASLDERSGSDGSSENSRPKGDAAHSRPSGGILEPEEAESVELRDDRARLTRALDRISPEQRAILILRDGRGLDYDQIADVLGVPGGTVKSRLFRARAALRDAMENDPR